MQVIRNNVKNVILKTNEFSLTKNILVYVNIVRKIYWREHDIKATIFRVLRNINQLYIPSLKISKQKQIKKLFEKINITIPDEGFIFSIDEYKILNSEDMGISNMSVDYSVILNNSLDDLYKIYTSNDEYCQAQKETLDAITLLIDRHIKELEKSNRSDREKFISFFKNIKNSKVSSLEEALQRILFFNQILWQTGHALNGFGRLDKILDDVYLKDSISKKDALKLLKNFLKSAHDYFYFKSGALSGDTGQIIVLGGMELNSEYFSNDLTYLFIEALKELQLPDPKIILRYCDDIPRDLMELAVECMASGIGSPLMSNDNLVVEDLVNFGYSRDDAVNYVVSACWEPAAVGKGFEMNNIGSLIFMEPLNNLLRNEDLNSFKTFDSLVDKYGEYLNQYCCNLLDDINKINWETDPVISLFYSECSENHKNIAEGGAKYNNYGLTSVSLSNTVNSLINIKKFVFEEKKFSLKELNQYRLENFENEKILKLLKSQNLKFGMDNEEVIDLTNKITLFANDAFKSKKTRFGGNFKFGLSSPGYISAGSSSEASFDGRKNFEEFHTHISFDDNEDYTELMRFASKLDYRDSRFNGNVVDFMVSPSFIKNNFDKFTDFIILSLKMGIFQMQLNVINSDILIKAKENPDDYPNLIVRVWGFSAYFRDLPPQYQDVLIKRALENEHKNH